MNELLGIICTALSVWGVWLNNRKLRLCFYLWIVSNAISLMLHLQAGMLALALRDALFFVLSIEGLNKWK